MRVEILDQKTILKQAIFEVEEVHLRHEKYDGTMSDPLTRLNVNRGDSTAVVLHDVTNNTIVLSEQFRLPTYQADQPGSGWIIEIPAGSVEPGEDPAATMKRELLEEQGYQVTELTHIATFYVSPGGTSERVILYYAQVKPEFVTAKGGGLAEEGEDIKNIAMPVSEALQKLAAGEFSDAKTIIGLQWLQMQQSGSILRP